MYTCIPLHIHKYMCSKVQIHFFLVKHKLLQRTCMFTDYTQIPKDKIFGNGANWNGVFLNSITLLILRTGKTL